MNRVYDRPIEQRKQLMEELDARYYPVAPPQTISEEDLKTSVNRQVDTEMERRKEREQEYDQNVYGGIEKSRQHLTMSASEQDSCVERLYNESLAKAKNTREENDKKYLFDQSKGVPGKMKTIGGADLKASAVRLSVPKKSTWTVSEINKVYGLA